MSTFSDFVLYIISKIIYIGWFWLVYSHIQRYQFACLMSVSQQCKSNSHYEIGSYIGFRIIGSVNLSA